MRVRHIMCSDFIVPQLARQQLTCVVPPGTEQQSVSIYDMEDGAIGVIVAWNEHTNYLGLVIQRYGDKLVRLGAASIRGWSDLLLTKTNFKPERRKLFRVVLLKPGTLLRLVRCNRKDVTA